MGRSSRGYEESKMRTFLSTLGILVVAAALVFPDKPSVPKGKEMPNVLKVKVDGLSCPFCAYGLEKYLKKIEGAKKVSINVDKGFAILQLDQTASIDVHAVRNAVKKGGFTPRETSLTVLGKVTQENGGWVFRVKGSDSLFILSENRQLEKLRKNYLTGKEIIVTAIVKTKHTKGHGEHPETLEIQEYKANKSYQQ